MISKTTPEQDKKFYDKFYSNVGEKTFRNTIVRLLKDYPNNVDFFREVRFLFGVENDTIWILDWVTDNFDPEDVFEVNKLYNWADLNGLKREE